MECIGRGNISIIIRLVHGMDGSKHFVLCDVHNGDDSDIYDAILRRTLSEGFKKRRKFIIIKVNVEDKLK